MRKYLALLAAVVLGLQLLGLSTAQADHAESWSANGDSFIVSETTVHLEGDNTSVETASLGINVDVGTEVSFDYELVDGALCMTGAPRVFLIVNGTNNKSEACDGSGMAEATGTISYEITNAGLITGAGVVYDSSNPGHVLVSNLTIGGEVVHFTNPEPAPEPCEFDAELTADDPDCVEPDPEPEPEPEPDPEPKDEEPSDNDGSDGNDNGDTTDVGSDDGTADEKLPNTGANTNLLGLLAAGLVAGGASTLIMKRRLE